MRAKRLTVSERLIRRLTANKMIPQGAIEVKFVPMRRGYWQKQKGAWSWKLKWNGGELGSSETAQAVVEAKLIRLVRGEIRIVKT